MVEFFYSEKIFYDIMQFLHEEKVVDFFCKAGKYNSLIGEKFYV